MAGWTAVVYAVGLLGTIAGTYWVSHRDGHLNEYFYENCAPNVVIMSVGAFLILKDFGAAACRRPLVSAITKKLSRASLGIYLIHPIVLDLMRLGRFGETLRIMSDVSTPQWTPVTALVIVAMSYVVVDTILRIRVLRRIV